MAIRLSHRFKRRELRNQGKITPAEYYLLDEIETATMGAQNERKDFCSSVEVWIADLSANLGYKSPAKIWRLLKSLQKKGLITREPTRSVGKEKIGLDPTFWDQVLIDTHHASELKRHLKIVPVSRTNQTDPVNEPSTPDERTVQGPRTNRSDSEHEKDPRLLQTVSDCSQTAKTEGESFTQETENGDRGSGDGNPPIATASAGASPSRSDPSPGQPDPLADMHPAFRKFMNGPPFAS